MKLRMLVPVLFATIACAANAANAVAAEPSHDNPQFFGCSVPVSDTWKGRTDVAEVDYAPPAQVYSTKIEDVWFRPLAARYVNGSWLYAYGDWESRTTSAYGWIGYSWSFADSGFLHEFVVWTNTTYTFGYQLWWPSYGYYTKWSNQTFSCKR